LEVNTATVEELTALPGIGLMKARAIVEWREQHGRFSSVDELTSVKGIGEKTLASIRAYVYVMDRGVGCR
jgi:competence protein ComEA